MVFAPHPDDESLGCGGVIARARAGGARVTIVVVTDGGGSHPRSRAMPPPAMIAARDAEVRAAARELGLDAADVHGLGYPDAGLPRSDDPGFEVFRAHVARVVERYRPRTVLVPWIHDPHRDHRSVTAAAYAAREAGGRAFRLLEYPIWMNAESGTTPPIDPPRAIRAAAIGSVLDRKRAAIMRHRTQTSDAVADDPTGFRFTARMLDGFLTPIEYFFEAP